MLTNIAPYGVVWYVDFAVSKYPKGPVPDVNTLDGP